MISEFSSNGITLCNSFLSFLYHLYPLWVQSEIFLCLLIELTLTVSVAIMQLEVSAALMQMKVSAANMWVTIFIIIM